MSMKDYIWHTSDIHRTYIWHTTYSMKDYISASISPEFLPGPLAQLARSYYHNRESYELLISCQGAYSKHRTKHRIFKSYSYLVVQKNIIVTITFSKWYIFFNFFWLFYCGIIPCGMTGETLYQVFTRKLYKIKFLYNFSARKDLETVAFIFMYAFILRT